MGVNNKMKLMKKDPRKIKIIHLMADVCKVIFFASGELLLRC